jgi:hypothetical protein
MKTPPGIFNQLNNSNTFYYKKLTIQDIEEAMLQIAKSYEKK